MKTLGAVIVFMLLTLAAVTPSQAAVVVITSAAPLEDQTDEGIQAALDDAVGRAVESATQMGLRPVQLADAQIWSDRVIVRVLATDEQRDEGEDRPMMHPGEHLAGSRAGA